MNTMSRSIWTIILLAILTVTLVACDGDTGPQGPQGEQGEQGEQGPPGDGSTGLPTVDEAVVINAEITSVTVASPPVVEFTLTDERGVGLIGLPGSAIGFTFSKLLPGTDGNASSWQSYINTIEEANGIGPGTEDVVQSTRDRGADDKLVDNGDGSYTYTFSIDVTAVTEPIVVDYEEQLTHRVAAQISGFVPVDNPIFTFRPDDMAINLTRDIVMVDTCNNCHERLELHGGSRNQTEYCVTCHNPGSTDAQSTNTVDLKQMIHKIHRGENLPTVIAGGEYAIWGFRDTKHDYSHVGFPQDIRNCRNCHDENNEETPDAANWINVPTMEACGACHDNVNFVTGDGHSGANIPATNADCLTCHGPDAFRPVEEVHRLLAQEASGDFQYNVIDAVNTGPGEMPTVKFSVTNPNDADMPYDIQNDDPFTQGGGASRVAIDIGWNTIDHTNTGSGSDVPGFRPGSAAQAISLDPLFGGSVDNGDGTFSVTSTVAIPAEVSGSMVVGVEGHPAVDVNEDGVVERIPVTGAVDYFAVTDSQALSRRGVVAIESCNSCHESLSLHGSNRTDNPQLCVICHNPNATDIRARVEGGVDENTSIDGLKEQAIDFKNMIHAIHDGNIAVYGFGGGEHDYRHVEFPGDISNCGNCHEGDSFFPVNQNFVLATTIDTGLDLGDPTDDVNISPNASACFGCHTGDAAVSHMKLNGGSFNASQDADGVLIDLDTNGLVVESCEVCHDEGRSADVAVAHGQ